MALGSWIKSPLYPGFDKVTQIIEMMTSFPLEYLFSTPDVTKIVLQLK